MDFLPSLVGISLFAALLIALSIVLFVVGSQRNWKYRFLSFLPLIVLIVTCYYYFRTPDSFYEDEFEKITQVEFPENGDIIYATNAPWFSFNGDHTSAFLVELSQTDIQSLKRTLKNRGFNKGGGGIINDQLDYIESKFGFRTYTDQFILDEGIDIYMVGFLDDYESVVFVLVDI